LVTGRGRGEGVEREARGFSDLGGVGGNSLVKLVRI
jgi:hypothetical protein